MSDILFIKTSSLGDVIHHMPALTEARLRLPDSQAAGGRAKAVSCEQTASRLGGQPES